MTAFCPPGPLVALRKESVDRNLISCINRAINIIVALRKESVDRNDIRITTIDSISKSLSARRAWIEIPSPKILWYVLMSLSARRAWIEICHCNKKSDHLLVALRKESVDRNGGGL